MTDASFKVKNGLIVNNALLVANTTNQRVGIKTLNPEVSLHVTGSDGIMIPIGNTAQRPGASANGMLRYNSDLGLFEGFANSAWGPIAGISNSAGSNTQLIFNNGSPNTYAASANLTFDYSNAILTTVNLVISGNATINNFTSTIGSIVQLGANTISANSATISGTISANSITLSSGSGTINSTSYSGRANSALSANTANTATTATSATTALTSNNTNNFVGQPYTYFLTPANLGLGTGNHVQHASIGSSYGAQGGGSIYAAGNIYSASNLLSAGDIIAYYSDIRFKENLEPISDPITKVMSIRCVTYDPNELALSFGYKPGRQMAVIAQDVQKVDESLVTIAACDHTPADITKSKSGENYLTVNYGKLSALNMAAIQALVERVQRLEERVQELENA